MGDVPAKADLRGLEVGKTTVGALLRLAQASARARVTRGIGNLAGAAEASALKEIRDAKLYVGLPRTLVADLSGTASDAEGECHTFEDFCDAIGQSRQRVYERIKLVEDLGEEMFGRMDELGVPRAALRLSMKIDGDSRRDLLKLARDPSTDRDKLVSTIKALAREAGAAEKEAEQLREEKAELEGQIEAGKKQLKKLSAQCRELKGEVSDWKAGRAMPEEDRAEMNEFAQRCAEVKGFFLRLSTYGWSNGKNARADGKGQASPLAGSFGALVVDTAMNFFDTLSGIHGLPTLTDRKLSQIKRLAEAGHLAADAVAEEE